MIDSPKYLIRGNLSEKQIEADVATFMGWCTPPDRGSPFRLVDVDEQLTGADKRFDCATAIYMQFKKSSGLKSVKTVAPSSRKGRSALEDIREFRAQEGLEDDPSLYFQLRAKAKAAHDLQHNILLEYERPPWSRAIYVAPLLLNKDAYSAALFNTASRFLLDPFYFHIRPSIYQHHWVSYFGAVPFLREHISIQPHERVADHNHYYAYSQAGVDISWHSPEVIDVNPRRLSDFMVALFRDVFSKPETMVPKRELAARIGSISGNLGFAQPKFVDNQVEMPMDFFAEHGKWLLHTHGIRQFILLGQTEYLRNLEPYF